MNCAQQSLDSQLRKKLVRHRIALEAALLFVSFDPHDVAKVGRPGRSSHQIREKSHRLHHLLNQSAVSRLEKIVEPMMS